MWASARRDRHAGWLPVALYAIGWWLAVAVALPDDQQPWPSEAWTSAIGPMLGWALLAIGAGAAQRPGFWVAAGLLASWTAFTAMPLGENWQDTYELHHVLIPVVTAACLLNSWSLNHMAQTGAGRWLLLIALAGLGGPLALAASTYASLAEWSISMVVATAVYAVAAMFKEENLPRVFLPAVSAAAGVVAAGRLHTYEDHPWWAYAVMFFLPTLVTLIDLPLRQRTGAIRIVTAAFVSAALLGLVVWAVLLRETESW